MSRLVLLLALLAVAGCTFELVLSKPVTTNNISYPQPLPTMEVF